MLLCMAKIKREEQRLKRFLAIGLLTATLGGGMIVSANAGQASGCNGADCQRSANSCMTDCSQDCVSWCQTEGCNIVSNCTNSCIEENCSGCDSGGEAEQQKRVLIETKDFEIVKQPYDIVKDENDAAKYTISCGIKFLKNFKSVFIVFQLAYVDGYTPPETYGYELESVQKNAEGIPGTITVYFPATDETRDYTISLKEIRAFDVDE